MQRGWRLRCAGRYVLERLATDVSHSSSRSFHSPISTFISTFHGKTLGQLSVKSDSRWTSAWHVPIPMAQRSRPLPLLMNQIHPFASKTKEKQLSHPPSKLKKTKMKAYASFKFRFRTLNSGLIRRWRAGKRHNAHLKSKKSKRRLRKPSIVPLAYAKVMKKLNFYG